MFKTYNWGIMATGKIAYTFAKAVNSVPDARLYACASRTKDKAEEFARKTGAQKAYSSYEELARDPDVDIVYIASPMSCHYENAKLCLENGKNVLCEKSITLNSGELERLVSLAREKGLFFMEAMWMKCLPAFLTAKKWADEGLIGDIRAIRADFSCPNPYNPSDRLFDAKLGGGALLDLGVYPITFITAFLGYEPESISSAVNIDMGIDLNETVIMKYKNAYASFIAGFDIDNDNRAVIVGTKGRIAFDPWFHCTAAVRLYDKSCKLVKESITPHPCNGYEYEIMEAQSCISANLAESRKVPLEGTAGVMRIMDNLRREWGLAYPGEA